MAQNQEQCIKADLQIQTTVVHLTHKLCVDTDKPLYVKELCWC